MSDPSEERDQRPATQADIDELAQTTNNAFGRVETDIVAVKADLRIVDGRLEGIEQRLERVEKQQESTHRVVESILTLVQTIDSRSKEAADHTERIERLEATVFASRTRG